MNIFREANAIYFYPEGEDGCATLYHTELETYVMVWPTLRKNAEDAKRYVPSSVEILDVLMLLQKYDKYNIGGVGWLRDKVVREIMDEYM